MSAFHKLLVPLDGSRLAEAVLPVVDVLAERFHATVSLLHVMERGVPQHRPRRALISRVSRRPRSTWRGWHSSAGARQAPLRSTSILTRSKTSWEASSSTPGSSTRI